MLHVSVSGYKQAEAERKSDPICRKVGGGLVCVPEGGVTMVECTISTRVDGDVLDVFWSYCSEVGFIKVHCNKQQTPHLGRQFPAHLYSRTDP